MTDSGGTAPTGAHPLGEGEEDISGERPAPALMPFYLSKVGNMLTAYAGSTLGAIFTFKPDLEKIGFHVRIEGVLSSSWLGSSEILWGNGL